MTEFKAGRIKYFHLEWRKITSDPFILNMVSGADIPLDELPDHQDGVSNQVHGNCYEFVNAEIEKLLHLGVLVKSEHEYGEIISPIFLVPKDDDTYRMILNLKKFNESVHYTHFKMENLNSALDLMNKGCFMASVDLRHAYYSVPVHENFQKYLKFEWNNDLYKFTCLPNGLSNCPLYFTKLLKPVYAALRSKGHMSSSFIDDCCLVGNTYSECVENVQDTVALFEALGFVVHTEKSVFEPCQKIKYLGFWLDSQSMSVTLTDKKKAKVKKACQGLKIMKTFTIRNLAQVIGIIVSCFPGVLYGQLHYRYLENLKSCALKINCGNFDAITKLDSDAEKDLDWWIDNVDDSFKPIEKSLPDFDLESDASLEGFGSSCKFGKAGGRWSKNERKLHINALELKAIENALKSFEHEVTGKHVKILTDNTCSVSYIRDMGGSRSIVCNIIAKRIWQWCINRNIWLSITYLPGILNVTADEKSRQFNDRTEWKLNENYFQQITQKFGTPSIDLFASHLNFQLKPYVSWGRDPECQAVDAFTLDWSLWKSIYVFPPFCLINRVLKKWIKDKANGIIVVPVWEQASWYPMLLRILTQDPFLLPVTRKTLRQPHNGHPHPLHKKLKMAACFCSGRQFENKMFQMKFLK